MQAPHFIFAKKCRGPPACKLDTTVQLCFYVRMDAAIAAEKQLQATVDLCIDSGLSAAWSALTGSVYSSNLDRYEPEELGDTAMSLGVQFSENFKTRALRRAHHDDLELPEDHWHIDGLTVSTPRNSLRFEIGGNSIFVMKAPYSEGRVPRWDLANQWDQGSDIRYQLAQANSLALGGYKTVVDADDPLFPHPARPGRIRNYLLVLAGEADSPLTAGWLSVPALGVKPFVAHQRLWWDDQQAGPTTRVRRPDRGPSFDERPAATPEITIKPRPAAEGGQA